jgi:hypothetical protein
MQYLALSRKTLRHRQNRGNVRPGVMARAIARRRSQNGGRLREGFKNDGTQNYITAQGKTDGFGSLILQTAACGRGVRSDEKERAKDAGPGKHDATCCPAVPRRRAISFQRHSGATAKPLSESRAGRELKNHAPPEAWVPAETTAANHRGYNNRRGRRYDNRPHGCDYDWTTIRDTSYETKMKAKTTSVSSTRTVSTDE